MKKQFMDTLRRTGLIETLGEARFFARVEDALEYAWAKLGPAHVETCPLRMPTGASVPAAGGGPAPVVQPAQ
jgi:SulP family sulfate permease